MPQLSKYGKLLGTKGLMPNPKVGTVNEDIAVAVENIKKGQVIYKTDDKGVMNIMFGKKSFTDAQLVENYQAILDLLKANKPAAVKGDLIKSIYVSTTMSPSVKIKK
jgi:large subunit ribosomal protein L1